MCFLEVKWSDIPGKHFTTELYIKARDEEMLGKKNEFCLLCVLEK